MSPGPFPDGAPDAGRRPFNPPGQAALEFRAGTFDSFTRQMMDRLVLALQRGAIERGEGAGREADDRPIRINLDGPDHWLGGLVKSWATVADVLTFYQERILQEGFLRTAVEERSVHELAQAIGYRQRPGVAGSADLAVRISEIQGLPQELDLPQGLVIRSVPPPGSEPQVFETRAPLSARASWNVLKPVAEPREVPPILSGGDVSLDLRGTTTGLVPGAGILIQGMLEGQPVALFRLVTGVSLEPGEPAFTRITWIEPLVPDRPAEPIEHFEILALRPPVGLFGHNAPRWSDLPPEVRQRQEELEGGLLVEDQDGWDTRNSGLPKTVVVQCILVDGQGTLFAGTASDGLYRSTDGGRSWKPVRRGLLQTDIQTLALGPEGTLFAGTPNGTVYRSTDGGEIWESASGGASLNAGSRRLLPRLSPPKGPLPTSTVRALALAPWPGQPTLFAATDAGLYCSRNGGRSWQPINRGLPGADRATGVTDLPVRAVAAAPEKGLLFAGTARGVFRSGNGGKRWKPANRGFPGTDPFSAVSSTDVRSLVCYRDRRRNLLVLLAATSAGLFRSTDGGESWGRAENGLKPPDRAGAPPEVLTLTIDDDPVTRVLRLHAGTAEGLFTSLDHGESWSRVALGPPVPVSALAVGRQGSRLVAAVPFSAPVADWPGFSLRGGRIDLDTVLAGVVPGTRVVLQPSTGSDPSAAAAFTARRALAVQRRDFNLAATVTRIEVDDPLGTLAGFDLRETRVFVERDSLAPRPRLVLEMGASLDILRAGLLAMGDPLRKVIVTGRTLSRQLALDAELDGLPASLAGLRGQLAEVGRESALAVHVWMNRPLSASPDATLNLTAGELDEALVAIINAPQTLRTLRNVLSMGAQPTTGLPDEEVAAAAGRLALRIDVKPKTAGATFMAGELAPYLETTEVRSSGFPAGGEEAPLVEVVRIVPPGSVTALDLEAASIQIFGNVVTATEGVTVRDEILGDGDATQPNPSFRLAQPPTFFRGGGLFPHSNLEVRVQNQVWEEVDSLLLEKGDRRVYRLRLDEEGRATVIFGDGEAGARLPSGKDNVTATYSTGMSSRTVAAGGLSLLTSRPLGLDGIANPLASLPGAPPESRDEIRLRAPRSVRLLDRIVSLREYEDFALGFPGIGKAGAWGLLVGGGTTVQITVAPPDGGTLDPSDPLLAALRDAIERVRCHPSPISIQGFSRIDVSLAAKIRIERGYRWDEVQKRMVQVLEERFGFPAATFGGGVSSAAVIAVLQGVLGVKAVDLDALHWPGWRAAEGSERRARPPFWDAERQQIHPAELVVLGRIDLAEDPHP